MAEYRDRNTGEVLTWPDLKTRLYPATIPTNLTQAQCDELGIDPVSPSDPPAPQSIYHTVQRDGVTQVNGEWVWAWVQVDQYPTQAEKDARRAEYIKEHQSRIDEAAGRARARFVSSGDLIEHEYKRAEEEARAFKAAGYLSEVPASVQADATANGTTAKVAADSIISRADYLKSKLDEIRTLRLPGKAAVAAASDSEIKSTADTYVSQLDDISPVTTGS